MKSVVRFKVKVMQRGEKRSGAAMSLLLSVDESGDVVELMQFGTITGLADEPPQHLIEVATAGGYWSAEDEQEFWESWVRYPEIPDSKHAWALESIRRLVQRWVVPPPGMTNIDLRQRIPLFLAPREDGGEGTLLMEVEIGQFVGMTILNDASTDA